MLISLTDVSRMELIVVKKESLSPVFETSASKSSAGETRNIMVKPYCHKYVGNSFKTLKSFKTNPNIIPVLLFLPKN
jgi:hypothetical protein